MHIKDTKGGSLPPTSSLTRSFTSNQLSDNRQSVLTLCTPTYSRRYDVGRQAVVRDTPGLFQRPLLIRLPHDRTRPREIVKVAFDYELANCPGKSIIGLQLELPPGGWTPPHRHGGAQVVALIQEGEMLSGMNGNPPKVYGPEQTFMELPGCHHTVGDNNSTTERCRFLAIMVVDTETIKTGGYAALTVLDEEWRS